MLAFILYIISVWASLKVWSIALDLEPRDISHMAWICFIPTLNVVVAILGLLSIVFTKLGITFSDKPLFDW